jgi:hypothetical protein
VELKKTGMKLSLVLLIALLVFALLTVIIIRNGKVLVGKNDKCEKKKAKKKVTFNSLVSVKHINGDKSERYNPDLKDCVKRNTMQAMSAGGMKALAQLDLS